MSLIVGPYYQGDPTIKPHVWGPASDVSAVIAERLEGWYGIPWSAVDTFCPFWGPGNQQDYSRHGDILVPHPSNPAIFSAGPLGMGFVGDSTVTGTAYGFTTSKNPDFYFDQKSAVTLIMWVTPINAAGGACLYDDGGSADGFSIAYKNTTKTFVFESTTGSDIETGGKLLLGESGSIGVTFDGSTAKIFLNASVEGSGSHGAIAATTAEPGIMGRNVSSATSRDNQFGGFLYQLLRLNIKISDDLYGRIAEDRFALIQPPTFFRSYFITSEATQSPILLTGSADAVAGAGGSISKKFGLPGAADAMADVAGQASVRKCLAGTADAIPAEAGSVSIKKALVGESAAVAGSAGTVAVKKGLSGSVGAVAVAGGQISIKRLLSGFAGAVAIAQGQIVLQGTIRLAGSVEATAGVGGQMSVTRRLAGVADAIAGAQGQMTILTANKLYLSGSAGAVTEAAGQVRVIRGLAGTVEAVAEVGGELSVAISLAGSVDAIADALGSIRLVGAGTLGVVIDPTIESVTVKRLLESITTEYKIKSI